MKNKLTAVILFFLLFTAAAFNKDSLLKIECPKCQRILYECDVIKLNPDDAPGIRLEFLEKHCFPSSLTVKKIEKGWNGVCPFDNTPVFKLIHAYGQKGVLYYSDQGWVPKEFRYLMNGNKFIEKPKN